MRFPIMTTDGTEYMIGGQPLVLNDRFKELYPELNEALDNYENEELEELERGQNWVLAASHIIKIFNPNVDIKTLLIDTYTIIKIMKIWSGNYEEPEEDKKKELKNTQSDSTGQE